MNLKQFLKIHHSEGEFSISRGKIQGVFQSAKKCTQAYEKTILKLFMGIRFLCVCKSVSVNSKVKLFSSLFHQYERSLSTVHFDRRRNKKMLQL